MNFLIFSEYSWTDKRCVFENTGIEFLELEDAIKYVQRNKGKKELYILKESSLKQESFDFNDQRTFIVMSDFGSNENRRKVHSRWIKNKLTALDWLDGISLNKKLNLYLYEIFPQD